VSGGVEQNGEASVVHARPRSLRRPPHFAKRARTGRQHTCGWEGKKHRRLRGAGRNRRAAQVRSGLIMPANRWAAPWASSSVVAVNSARHFREFFLFRFVPAYFFVAFIEEIQSFTNLTIFVSTVSAISEFKNSKDSDDKSIQELNSTWTGPIFPARRFLERTRARVSVYMQAFRLGQEHLRPVYTKLQKGRLTCELIG
jgi:hypothetical protein